MRPWLLNQRGFTLAELLVATAIIGMVMAGVFIIQRQGQEVYLLGSSRVETQQNARVALDLMTRELRSSQSVTTLANATDITFVDQEGQTVRYAIVGTTLNRTVAGNTTPLIGGAETLTMTYCLYDVARGKYTITTDVSRVEVIKIRLRTKTEENAAAGSAGDQHAVMESTVKLRRDAAKQPVPLAADCV